MFGNQFGEKNEKREGQHVNQKEYKLIYQLFEICKIKMLSLQDKENLAEEVHKYLCLYDKDQVSALVLTD